ncbi:MAG TPA: branched-chain amino acid ABC transporter permease [Atribacterota bacterium]|nr:branched-chain amino acid ABC transporter permease [Atribacterota bacterium]
MVLIINQVITGLMLGIMYALIASGFSLLFGVLNVVQFAHADLCFLGAFVSMAVMTFLSKIEFFPAWLVIFITVIFTVIITGLIGIIVEKVCVKPFRKSPGLIILLSTVAVGFIIREGIKIFYPSGASPKLFPLSFPQWAFSMGGVTIRFSNIMIIIIAGLIYFLLSLFINKTKIGLQIRATSQNVEAAQVFGIDLDKIFMITFFLASAIGAVAGILNGIYYNIVKFDMGLMGGVIGFSAAVMGGLGNVYGAIIGGLILGIVESFTMAFVPGGSPYKEIFAFIVVVLFLLFKPSGILGKKVIEKV